jgi:hypothetical protein
MLKRILIAALMLPLVALAQSYPSPTFNNVTVQGTLTAATPAFTNPVPVASGGTGATSAATARTNLGAASTGANTFTGNQTISASGSPQFVVNDTSGTGTPRVQLQSNAVNTWALVSDNTANTFALFRYVGGTLTDRPVSFASGTGAASFTVRPTFNGATPWDSANLASPASTASPAFTGTPTAPTATTGTNTTQLATTAFVLANSGGCTSCTITTPNIVGVTNGSNAAAGSVGEYASNTTSGTSLTTSVAVNATSVSLTAGDWDVTGEVQYLPAGGTTVSTVNAGIGTTSATTPSFPNNTNLILNFVTGNAGVIPAPVVRLNLSSTTTVFLVASAVFSGGTATCNGFIRARRVR